jgi:non-canonical poly(A) RNA polymerase PAPD5/7
MYQFGQDGRDEYRPSRDSGAYSNDRPYRDQKHREFTFRSDNQTQFPPTEPRFERRRRGRGGKPDSSRRDWHERKPWAPKAAVNREILHSKVDRQTTPERLTGMSEGLTRFKNLDELSESSSEMDFGSDGDESVESKDDGDHSTKRTKQAPAADDGNSVPRWSNPDPYTALPPIDVSRGKKTDVVDFIRKAKLAAEQEKQSNQRNDVADNVDFISFGMDDEESTELSTGGTQSVTTQAITGSMNDLPPSLPVSAQSTSNQFSHLSNLHPMLNAGNSAAVYPSPVSSTQNYSAAPPVAASNSWPPKDIDAAVGVKPPQRQPKSKKRKHVVDGEIESEWESVDRASATPWCTVDHSGTENMGYW